MPAVSFGYSIESPISAGCHERLTAEAFRAARAEFSLPPIAMGADEKLLLDGLPFTVPDDLRDVGGMALLIGVRDNDLKGHSLIDTVDLPAVHADGHAQDEHCLRRAEHDGEEGNAAALAECRAFIRDMILEAVDSGLGSDGLPDPERISAVEVHLESTPRVTVLLPTFHLFAGRALHALQDSFTHGFRSKEDVRRVTVVLNWVEYAEDRLDEERDGPAHLRALDDCEADSELHRDRVALAKEASLRLLQAAVDPEIEEDDRRARIDAVLDEYVSFEPGCTWSTNWCDAEELTLVPPCGCSGSGLGPGLAFAIPLVLALLSRVRRSRFAASAVALAGFVLATAAEAEDSNVSAAPPRLVQHAAVGASVDNAALSTRVGARYEVHPRWSLGAAVEWNPWWSFETARFRPGVANLYASVVREYPISERVTARTSGHLGVSKMLFASVGASPRSTGLYAAISFLGLDVGMANGWSIVIEPCEVSLPVPHLKGAPLAFRQYRFVIAVEYGR